MKSFGKGTKKDFPVNFNEFLVEDYGIWKRF
jgi:hypothetical protein